MLTRSGSPMRTRTMPLLALALFAMADIRLFSNIGGLPSFTLTEMVSFAVIALVFMDAVIYPEAISKAVRGALVVNPALTLFFLWAAFAAVAKVLLGQGLFGVASFKDLLPSALLLISLGVYLAKDEDFSNVWKCLLVGIAVNVILALSQAFFGGPYPVQQASSAAAKMSLDGLRVAGVLPSGWFTHPNAFAVFLVPCLALLVPVALGRAKFSVVWRILAIVGIPLVAYCLYKTQGKGAMFWAAVGALVAFFVPWFKKKAALLAIVLVPVVICLLVYITLEMAAVNRTYSTMSTRVELWNAGARAVGEGWVSFAFGTTPFRMLDLSFESTFGHFPYANAHNGIINQAVNYGVPAALLYLAAIVLALRQLGQIFSRGEDVPPIFKALAGAAFGAIVALVGEAFFEPSTDGVVLQCQFFILLIISGFLARFVPKSSNGF